MYGKYLSLLFCMPDNNTTTNQEPTNEENETETETSESTEVPNLHYENEVIDALIGATEEDEGKE